ncbi:MAG: acyltransferase [Propionibacteriaceae bacterium]
MSSAREPRNHLIDAARAASILVVVWAHCMLYQISLVDGRPKVTPWAPGPIWWFVSWVFMIMPTFFIAGGFGHAISLNSTPPGPAGLALFLAQRGRRLVGPLVLFISFLTVTSTLAAWFWDAPAAILYSAQLCQLLWFLTVYLVVALIAPAMVRLHDRYGVWVMIVLALAAASVDAWSFAVNNYQLRNLNMLLVWPLCHQFGIAYQRGWWRRQPAWLSGASIVAGIVGVVVLVFGFGYPASALGFANIPIANIQPPTLAMACLGLAQAGALGLLEKAGFLRVIPPKLVRPLAVANALAVTLYLWHIPFIFLSGMLLLGLSYLLPGAAPVFLWQGTLLLVTVVVLGASVMGIGRVEAALIPPLGTAPRLGPTIVAYLVLVGATALVWHDGTVLHPSSPGSVIGVLGIYLGVALMAKASGAGKVSAPTAAAG